MTGASAPPTGPPTGLAADRGAGPVVLLDTATLYYRAFHALPSSITAPDGTRSGAVRGTLDALAGLVTDLRPSLLVACWDEDWRPAWRTRLVPSYKAHRALPSGEEAAPEGLAAQVEGLVELLAALGVPRRGAPGAEADDVAATLAERAASAGHDVVVVSGDRDLFQLVREGGGGADGGTGDGRVRVRYLQRGARTGELLDAGGLAEATGLSGAALTRPGGVGASYADLAVLRGDPSDGLPGASGIGARTAAALVSRFGSLEGVLAAAGEDAGAGADGRAGGGAGGGAGMTVRQREVLRGAAAALTAAAQVVRARRDVAVDLPAPPPAGLRDGVDDDALSAAAERWGAAGPVARLLAALEALPRS